MYCTIAKTDREYYWPRVNCFFFLHIILSSQCLWKRVEERSWRLISMSCGCSTEKLLSHMDIWRERLHCTVVQHTHAAWIWCVCSTRTATLFSPTVIYVLLIFAFFFLRVKKRDSHRVFSRTLSLVFASFFRCCCRCFLPFAVCHSTMCNMQLLYASSCVSVPNDRLYSAVCIYNGGWATRFCSPAFEFLLLLFLLLSVCYCPGASDAFGCRQSAIVFNIFFCFYLSCVCEHAIVWQ